LRLFLRNLWDKLSAANVIMVIVIIIINLTINQPTYTKLLLV